MQELGPPTQASPPIKHVLCIEALANKYNIPALALTALEELQRKLTHPSSTQESVTSTWQIAERAVHWNNTGVLDTCMEVVTRPLLSDTPFMCDAKLIELPLVSDASLLHNLGAVRSVIRAVNKAVAIKAGYSTASLSSKYY